MSSCNLSVDQFQREDGTLEVEAKYKLLMQTTLGEDSLYTRSKETMFEAFDKLNITDGEKAQLVSQNIMQLATQMSQASMQSAVMWAQQELELEYSLAKMKADTKIALVTYEKIAEETCLLDKEEELKCAQIEATIASSIRDNGRVEFYKQDADGDTCHPEKLEDEGLKYYQTKQVIADSYRIFADSYRKSGVVVVGTDGTDGVEKGLSGDQYGYTQQQINNAERQRIAYEDSKVNHAANSSATMIGQMLSNEVTPDTATVDLWRTAVTRLVTPYYSTPV